LRTLLLSLALLLTLPGCIAGPTPHPLQQESAGADGPNPDSAAPANGGSVSESDVSSSSDLGADGAMDSLDAASDVLTDSASDVLTDSASDVLTDSASDVMGDTATDAVVETGPPGDAQSADLEPETLSDATPGPD
jgi:hypothetical protein